MTGLARIMERPDQSASPPHQRGLTTHTAGRQSGMEVSLDVSRLISRMLHPAPTGVDRVEIAYAIRLQRLIPDTLRFSAVHPTGLYGRLPIRAVTDFLDATQARWECAGASEPRHVTRRLSARYCWTLRPRPIPAPKGPRILLQVSPHHLDQPGTVARKLASEQARFVCLVHDLIPISHPEYARPDGQARHRQRIATIERHADGILTNSRATLDTFFDHSRTELQTRPARVAHLGIDLPAPALHAPSVGQGDPYFICISTIEPRKNHLLLLNVWRSMVEAIGPTATPRLLLVGRRGWENENIIDMLDRCDSLRGIVQEMAELPDARLRDLLANARALLTPSFVEGFGLPVAEALAVGVPVIASDIPAHREVGRAVPEYIDPLDGAAWRNAILDYQAPASKMRAAQIARMKGWQPTTWDQHMNVALSLIKEVASG